MSSSVPTPASLFLRTIIIGLSGTAAFSLFEVWPRRLPRWLERWVMQVVAVGLATAGRTYALALEQTRRFPVQPGVPLPPALARHITAA